MTETRAAISVGDYLPAEICVLLGYHTALNGKYSFLPKFWNNLSVSTSSVKQFQEEVVGLRQLNSHVTKRINALKKKKKKKKKFDCNKIN